MNLTSLELRHLRYFVALAEALNFRLAAERLHVSTPALSLQIKKLEEILGVRLCERDTTYVRLTITGEVFLRRAREVLDAVQNAVDASHEAAQGIQGRLRIGIPGHYHPSFIPEVLNTYRQQFPQVVLTLFDLTMEEEQMEALKENRIHVGFVYASQLPLMKGVDHLLMIDVPVRAVMSATHPLAKHKEVTLAQMADYPYLTIPLYKRQTQRVLAAFQKKNVKLKVVKKASTFHTCMAMVIAGEGTVLLPELPVMLTNPALTLRPVKGVNLRFQVHAVWKKVGVSPQVLNFVELLRENGVQHE